MSRPPGDALRQIVHAFVGAIVVAVYVVVVVPVARVRARTRRRRGERPRILWAPIPIINIHYASRADRLQGYSSDSLVYDVYSINTRDRFDYVLTRLRRVPVLGNLVPYATFLWAGLRYDIFCFYFDGGLLHSTPWWRTELALVRLAGRSIVVLPYGGDARLASRTRELGRWHAYVDVPPDAEDRDEGDIQQRREAFGRRANVMLGCADIVDLPRVDGMFRFPYDTSAIESAPPSQEGGAVRVVHAPNHRHYKGTRYLLETVEALQRESLPVELELVEGLPNDEARRRYAEADIIADQFLAGAYALFAIEGMALGKPVICYLNPRFLPHHPEWKECPLVSANPDELRDVLRELVLDGRRREELGRRGIEYVQRYHSLESVGRDMARLYERLRG